MRAEIGATKSLEVSVSSNILTIKPSGCLGTVMNSFVGSIFGLLIFLGAFFTIWFNEGRPNLALVAAESLPAGAGRVDAANENQFLALTGRLTAQPLGDDLFLRPGDYLQIRRTVEMYAWVEERRSGADSNDTGPSAYTYDQQWTASPESGDSFAQPSGHRNPRLELEGGTFTAEGAQLGAYAVDLSSLQLPSEEALPLGRSALLPRSQEQIGGDYIFRGFGSLERPEIGDVRISFAVVPADREVTAFGAQRNGRLEPYWSERYDVSLYRALPGSREAAIAQLDSEHRTMGWILRVVSLLMLWGGLALAAGPLTAMAGFLPALRQVGGCAVSMLLLIPAIILWAIAEAVAIIAHNPWLLAGTALLIIVALLVAARLWRLGPREQPSVSG
jgi:hypothetical protein